MDSMEFKQFLQDNSTVVNDFRDSALTYQQEKNLGRPRGKRFDDERIEKETDVMVAMFVVNVYNKLKSSIKVNPYSPYESWTKFIEQNNVLEDLDDSVAEMEFEA